MAVSLTLLQITRNCSRSPSKKGSSCSSRVAPSSARKDRGRSSIAVVRLVRNVLVGLVGEQQGRTDAYGRADTDVEADRERGMICREQPGRDERRWSACNDRGELITQRGAAVAQPRRECLRDQRGFRPVHCHHWNERERHG